MNDLLICYSYTICKITSQGTTGSIFLSFTECVQCHPFMPGFQTAREGSATADLKDHCPSILPPTQATTSTNPVYLSLPTAHTTDFPLFCYSLLV